MLPTSLAVAAAGVPKLHWSGTAAHTPMRYRAPVMGIIRNPHPTSFIRALALHCLWTICLSLCSCNTHNATVGEPAREFEPVTWLQSPPLQIKNLRSKVVLLRWWTDECLFCTRSQDALNHWHRLWADQGLVVIGMYHPKPSPRKMESADVQLMAADKNFEFPIAVDDQWKNLNKYKPFRKFDDFTSPSYLIDKKGMIRYYHRGGEYHRQLAPGHENCVAEFQAMDSLIRQLLLEH